MSWLALAAVAITVAVCESTHDTKCNCNYRVPLGYGQSVAAQGAQKLMQMRTNTLDIKLSKGTHDIHTLQTKVDKILGKRDYLHRKVKQIQKRIEHLEGKDCEDENHFACRDGSNRCISSLLVCDHVKDCNNGADEDKHLCAGLKTGTHWVAHPKAADAGCTGHYVDKITVTLNKVVTSPFIPGRPRVEANVIGSSHHYGRETEEFYHQKGTWDPAHQRMILNPPEKYAPWGIACTFDGVDDSHCVGQYYNIHTHESCGHFTFSKQ